MILWKNKLSQKVCRIFFYPLGSCKIPNRMIVVVLGCQNVQKMRLKNQYLTRFSTDGAQIVVCYTPSGGAQICFNKLFFNVHTTLGRWHCLLKYAKNEQEVPSINFHIKLWKYGSYNSAESHACPSFMY